MEILKIVNVRNFKDLNVFVIRSKKKNVFVIRSFAMTLVLY